LGSNVAQTNALLPRLSFFFIIAFGFVLDFCDCVWVPSLHKQMLPREFDHRFGPCN
jgi:hypothetical protein